MFYVLVISFIVITFILDHVLSVYYSILLLHGNMTAIPSEIMNNSSYYKR